MDSDPSRRLEYVYEGKPVRAWIKDQWLLCVVACSMGDTARVVNELHGVDTWFRVDELRTAYEE